MAIYAAKGSASQKPNAEYRQTFILRILSLLTLAPIGSFFILITIIDKGSVLWLLTGAVCLVVAVLVWINGHMFLVQVYAGKISRRNLFGERVVELNERTKFYHRKVQEYINGIAAGRHIYITVRDGKGSMKLNSNIRNIEQLQNHLMEVERSAVSPAYMSRYKSGSLVSFGPLSIQRGQLIYKKKSASLRDIKSAIIAKGKLKIRLKDKILAFCDVSVSDLENMTTFFLLLESAFPEKESFAGSRKEVDVSEAPQSDMIHEKAQKTATGSGPSAEESAAGAVCKQCGSTAVEQGRIAPLCQRCRAALARRPMPPWIKALSAAILVFFAAALFKFPDAVKAGVHFERGVQAEKEKKYITAQNHFKAVTEIYPESVTALAKLFISYGMNQYVGEASKVLEKITGKKLSNKELLGQVNEMISSLDSQYDYNEDLIEILEGRQNETLGVTRIRLEAFVKENPKDGLGFAELGNVYIEMGMYPEAAESCVRATALNPNLQMAHIEAAAAFRQSGQIERSRQEINEVLKNNAESVNAYAALARTQLKERQYNAALLSARKGCELDGQNDYAAATLAIVCHFNKMYEERDRILQRLKDAGYGGLNVTTAIINGTLKLYE